MHYSFQGKFSFDIDKILEFFSITFWWISDSLVVDLKI